MKGIVAARIESWTGGIVLISHTVIPFVVNGEDLYDAEDKGANLFNSIGGRSNW